MRWFLFVLIGVVSCQQGGNFSGSHCGTQRAPEVSNPLGKAFPLVALSAPTASCESSSTEPLPILASGLETLQETMDARTFASCVAGMGDFQPDTTRPGCFGPALVYQNHPDSNESTDDGGTLTITGVWTPDEKETQACLSAKTNGITQEYGKPATDALRLFAALICVANVDGQNLPNVGKTLDVTSTLDTHLSSATITKADIERLSDDGEMRPRYELELEGTLSGNAFNLTLTHSYGGTDAYTGRLSGYASLGGSTRIGFSWIYLREGRFQTTLYKTARNHAGSTSFFNGSGDVDFQLSAFELEGHYQRSKLDIQTGVGSTYLAWQPLRAESYSRVIQTRISQGGGPSDTGISYFGFGPSLLQDGAGSIDRMICNLTGPNPSTIGLEGIAQSQGIYRTREGPFFYGISNTKHSPTNECEHEKATFEIGTTLAKQRVFKALVHELKRSDALGSVDPVDEATY